MSSFNKVILVGRLGKKPSFKQLPSGSSVCNFTLCTNESWTDKSGKKEVRAQWHKILAWGKLAALCLDSLDQGSQVFIEGKIQHRSYRDKEGLDHAETEIQAQTITLLDEAEIQSTKTDVPILNEKKEPVRQKWTPPLSQKLEDDISF